MFFSVRGTFKFDLDTMMEGGNREFGYNRQNSTYSFITGNHRHPDGSIGTIEINPASGENVQGLIYQTSTNSGNLVIWSIVDFNESENFKITIQVFSGISNIG